MTLTATSRQVSASLAVAAPSAATATARRASRLPPSSTVCVAVTNTSSGMPPGTREAQFSERSSTNGFSRRPACALASRAPSMRARAAARRGDSVRAWASASPNVNGVAAGCAAAGPAAAAQTRVSPSSREARWRRGKQLRIGPGRER